MSDARPSDLARLRDRCADLERYMATVTLVAFALGIAIGALGRLVVAS